MWPTPISMIQVQQFLGFASYYHSFVQGNGRAITLLIEDGATFLWTNECQSAFEKLCHLLTTTSLLAYPDFNWAFILDTDATGIGVGAVLSQVDEEGQERVAAYGSQVLSKAEQQ